MSRRGAGAANLSKSKSTKKQPSEEEETKAHDLELQEEEEDDEVSSRARQVEEQAIELASEEDFINQEDPAQEVSSSSNRIKKRQTSTEEDGGSLSASIVLSDGWPQLGTWAAKWSSTNMDFINPFYQIIERGKKYWSQVNSHKVETDNETTASPAGEIAGTNQKLIVHTTEVTLVTQWTSQTREKFQMQFQQAISNQTNLSRYDCMAPQPQADIDMFFRNEGIDHKSLSDPEFLAEFKRIMCNHEVSHGAQAPLEKLL